jgi:hypothetical protein
VETDNDCVLEQEVESEKGLDHDNVHDSVDETMTDLDDEAVDDVENCDVSDGEDVIEYDSLYDFNADCD